MAESAGIAPAAFFIFLEAMAGLAIDFLRVNIALVAGIAPAIFLNGTEAALAVRRNSGVVTQFAGVTPTAFLRFHKSMAGLAGGFCPPDIANFASVTPLVVLKALEAALAACLLPVGMSELTGIAPTAFITRHRVKASLAACGLFSVEQKARLALITPVRLLFFHGGFAGVAALGKG